MGERGCTMRWQWLVVLVIVSFASSESSADEVQTLGDYYGDMSVTTDSDGEVTPGRFGDYSDWVKKYHIGAHHPYHATKVGEHKVRHHKASSTAPAHVAKPAAAKATKKVAAKVEKSSRCTEDVAVEKPAEQKVSEEKESQHTKGAAKQDAAVLPDPADALEAELAKLENSSADDDVQTSVSDAAPAKAATDSESTKATDSATAAAADDASHKKETKAAPAKSADNLRESKDGSQHISLDSLESTLKQLEAKHDVVSLIEEQESSTAKNSASADASIKAPDMLAMLAAKFKHKEESRRKDAMSDAKVDEDKAAQKEAAMAKKFQSQFMLAEDKHAKKLENKHAPKNIEEALAKQTVKLQPGEKAVGKGSVGHEDAKAEAEAAMAKKMTQQFVSYQKTLDTKSKKTAKKATKESLTALFGLNKAKVQKSEQQDLGEQAETGMSAGDESAMKWAAAALHKSEGVADKAEHKNDEDSTEESKESLAEMFGLQHQNDVKKTRSQLISESRKKLLGDGDKQALEMQTAMTQRSMQLQQQNQANADAEVGGSDSKGDLASLFKGSKQQAKVAADSNTRFAENQEATQQLQQQQEVLLASQNREAQAHNSKDPVLTQTSVASLFKGQTQQASKSAHKNVPQDVKDAMKMQQQFTQKTQTHDHKHSDKTMTESNVKALFGESNDPKEQTADLSNSVGEEAKQQQLQMLKQTNSRSEGNVGEALGNLDGTDKHSAIEHLFQGTQHKQQGEFAYKSKGEQKKLQHEFASAANHQITLLKQMQTAQVNSRAQESLQESQSNHDTKWDELAYQNKLRGLFGAKLIKKPKQQQLRHKHAVSQFQDEINAATSFANAKPKHKHKSARAKQTAPYQESAIKNEDSLVQMDVGERRDAIEDLFRGKHSHQKQQKSHKNNRQEVTESKPHKKSPQALNKQFDSLLQEETNQFQQLMKSKKQQMGVLASKGQQLAGEEFLHLMKEKFDELKTNVATYTSEKKQPADPIASGDSLVQVQEASNTNDGAGNNLKERIHSLAPDTRKRVLKDVAETVLNDPSSTTLHSSMLNCLTKLFHESD